MPDLDYYGFFYKTTDDETDTYDYNAQEYAAFVRLLMSTGVSAHFGSQLRATRSGATFTILPGAAIVHGYHGASTSNKSLTVSTLAAGQQKAGYIVLKATANLRKVVVELLEGATVSGTPTLPAIPEPTDIVAFLPLYSYTVNGGSVSDPTDRRTFNLCGANIRAGTADPAAVDLRPGEIYIQV
jgi:hypothetical protein